MDTHLKQLGFKASFEAELMETFIINVLDKPLWGFKASFEAELMETTSICIYLCCDESFKASFEAELMETIFMTNLRQAHGAGFQSFF